MNKRISLFAFLFILCLAVRCQTRNVRHYTINEGLANNAVYSISQDMKGRMWFGTIDGVHSFDGNGIRVWRDERVPSLGSSIYTIREDDRQRLWIGSDQGLALFNLRTESFSTFDVQTVSGVKINTPVSHIMLDSKKTLWIGTVGQGLFHYDSHADKLYQYTALGKINSDYISYILEDSSGIIWVATMNAGVSRFVPSEDLFQQVAADGVKNTITLFEDSRRNLWVGSSGNGLYLLEKKDKQLVQKLKPSDSKGVLQVRSIVEWIPGELLIASDEGLTSYNIVTGKGETLRSDYRQTNGLNDNYLQTLFVDHEQALWVGTYFGGVNYIPPTGNSFIHYYRGNTQLDARIISVFAQADQDNLWLGTDDAGFFYWDRKKNTFKSYKPQHSVSGPTYHNIHALLQDGDKLYIGMYMGGLDIMDLKTGKFKNYKFGSSSRSLYASGIYALYKDSAQCLWVGTTNGLNKYIPETDDFERIYEVHPANVSYIMEDKKGYLWVCSLNQGIFRLDRKTQKWEHFSLRTGEEENQSVIPSNKIITACLDEKENLWFGTDGCGLLKYNYEEEVFEKVVLPENIRVVHKIIAANNELWLTTSNGMYCYQPENGSIKIYNKLDGLQENQFLPNSGIQLADGTIFVGGINGFNEFHPDRLASPNQKTTVVLADFQLFNKPVKVGSDNSPLSTSITYADHLVLEHKHSIFSLSVATLNYANPSKNQYKYKLEGFEKDWTETNSAPRVTYTNLPSGNYTFRVSASNGDGVWNENAIVFPIRVLPPWWASTCFIILYVCMGIGMLACLYYRMNKKQREKLMMMAVEKDKEIYQSKIEFFTHMIHEIRTPLTLILAPLENVMRSTGSIGEAMPQLLVIERNGKRLLSLVNQLMDFRKVESGGMNVTLVDVDIKAILAAVCQRFSLSAELKNVKIVLTMPDAACYAKVDPEAFTKIVSNLLTNALKFTVSHIWIDLIPTEENKLELRIKDNGQGIAVEEQEKIFTPFYQIRENRPTDNIGTGVGLLLVKKLVSLMHGELKLESELGLGATFIIWFDRSEQGETLQDEARQTVILPQAPIDVTEQKPYHILVVDDNQDLLNYLRMLLAPRYQITCASNGKEALDLLSELMPDLVISDVMMPVMDGMELCRKIKQNFRTSHLPVVLLTAKVETGDYVEGLENGADLYVAKPFSSDIIKAQIHSLLSNRERMKGSFKTEPMLPSASVASSRIDKEFLEKVTGIIESRMIDSDFSVDVLAQEIGISRTGLFTKLKAVSGMTPNDFIRIIRLKKAAVLLSQDGVQVSEACFQVGFSSPSYFAKCFQAQFGVAPTEFKRMKTVN